MTAIGEASRVRAASACAGLLLTLPGFYVGLLGVADMAPSSPQGIAGLAELLGFGFCAWAVFCSIRMLCKRFLKDVLQVESLIGAAVIACGFYLLMTVLGLEASLKHKMEYTSVLQPLGWLTALLLTVKFARHLLRRTTSEQSLPPQHDA